MVLLKIRYGDDVRRFTLADPSIEELRRTVTSLYPAAPSNFLIKYQDEDSDLITLKVRSCISAFSHLFHASRSKQTLRRLGA